MRPQSPIDLPLASISMFSSLVCQGKRLVCVYACVWGCVHMLVPISPSSLLSLSSHIQMSRHLSCKCLPVCVISDCTCVFFTCIRLCARLLLSLCVRIYVLVYLYWVYYRLIVRATHCACACVCVCDHIVMQASLTVLPAVPELKPRGPTLSPGVDKRQLFKERWGKMTRPCQSWTNSLLTPWASLLEQFKEREGEKPGIEGKGTSGFI